MAHWGRDGRIRATTVDSALFLVGVAQVVRSDTGWASPTPIDSPGHSDWLWPDNEGGVHFYGNDYATPPRLYYSHWQVGRFLVHERLAPDRIKVTGRQTQLDGHENLHVFWTGPVAIPGGDVTGLYHRCIDDQLNQPNLLHPTGKGPTQLQRCTIL